jgi:hypothetical protein
VTRYRNGSIDEEILLARESQPQWIKAVAAEELLSQLRENKSLQIAIMRAPVRLGRLITEEEYHGLATRDKDILQMSQRIYNSFRAFQEVAGKVKTHPDGGEGNSSAKASQAQA